MYKSRIGDIRWLIPTSIKVVSMQFSLALTVFQILNMIFRNSCDLENIAQGHIRDGAIERLALASIKVVLEHISLALNISQILNII